MRASRPGSASSCASTRPTSARRPPTATAGSRTSWSRSRATTDGRRPTSTTSSPRARPARSPRGRRSPSPAEQCPSARGGDPCVVRGDVVAGCRWWRPHGGQSSCAVTVLVAPGANGCVRRCHGCRRRCEGCRWAGARMLSGRCHGFRVHRWWSPEGPRGARHPRCGASPVTRDPSVVPRHASDTPERDPADRHPGL